MIPNEGNMAALQRVMNMLLYHTTTADDSRKHGQRMTEVVANKLLATTGDC